MPRATAQAHIHAQYRGEYTGPQYERIQPAVYEQRRTTSVPKISSFTSSPRSPCRHLPTAPAGQHRHPRGQHCLWYNFGAHAPKEKKVAFLCGRCIQIGSGRVIINPPPICHSAQFAIASSIRLPGRPCRLSLLDAEPRLTTILPKTAGARAVLRVARRPSPGSFSQAPPHSPPPPSVMHRSRADRPHLRWTTTHGRRRRTAASPRQRWASDSRARPGSPSRSCPLLYTRPGPRPRPCLAAEGRQRRRGERAMRAWWVKWVPLLFPRHPCQQRHANDGTAPAPLLPLLTAINSGCSVMLCTPCL